MKSQVPHTVWCYISGEAAGEIWHWSLLGVRGLTIRWHSRSQSLHGTSWVHASRIKLAERPHISINLKEFWAGSLVNMTVISSNRVVRSGRMVFWVQHAVRSPRNMTLPAKKENTHSAQQFEGEINTAVKPHRRQLWRWSHPRDNWSVMRVVSGTE